MTPKGAHEGRAPQNGPFDSRATVLHSVRVRRAVARRDRAAHETTTSHTEHAMAKGQQGKKEVKKESKLTLKEKRAAKAAKKAMKG